jgi:CRP-like cAMP-binding protein
MEKSTHRITCDDELFTEFKLFAELDREELKTLIAQSTTVHYETGQRIIAAGDTGHTMYVILQGTVSVTVKNHGQDMELAALSAGDFFGEVALVDDGPRSADVAATSSCELLCITRMTLGVLAGLQPGAAIHLLASIGRCLVARLRAGNQKYMDLILLGRQPV